jgi:VanZ family protein
MRKILGAVCALILWGLLVAALWPFNPIPPNEVSWLPAEDGLRFGDRATIYSSGVFDATRWDEESFCSLEIWLQPDRAYANHSHTILVFYRADNPFQFRLTQYHDSLFVRRDYRDQQNRLETAEIEIDHAFRRDEKVLLTITVGLRGTSVYRNGEFVDAFRRFGLSCKNLSGQLVLGSSPLFYETWQGSLLGLAIYNQGLTAEQVSKHYAMWTQKRASEAFKNDGAIAVYSFGERSGRTIRNGTGPGPSLFIPETFGVLHKRLLTPPWEEFSPDLGYVWDLVINIAGFIPFGFFVCAYLAWNRQWNRAAAMTIVSGGILGLTIEILQWFIPSRSSGVTDIITNTLGTGLGAMLWMWQPVRVLAAKLGGSQPPRSL